MKARMLAASAAAAALVLLNFSAAEAATGPLPVQRLAQAQTQLLLSHLTTPVGVQIASPSRCDEGQAPSGTDGTYLLPTRAGGSGDQTFDCVVQTRTVLVDLGGAFVTEDARANSPYVTASGEEIPFTKDNLERICDDILPRFFTAPWPATVDGRALRGAKAVSTAPFTSTINQGTGKLYGDSVSVGHPGTLATTYCGWKAVLSLSPGSHQVKVNFEGNTGFTFTYNITVRS